MNQKKINWGISGYSHDASVCILRDNDIQFASSSERFSRVKNDKNLNLEIVNEALNYGYPDTIAWYENPYKRCLRSILIDKQFKFKNIKSILKSFNINAPVIYCDHHVAHLNTSLLTCPFDVSNALGMVVDTVGEFLSLSLWHIKNTGSYKCIYKHYYPDSLGLFYSSITDLVGLKPQEDEYILMGMSSYGNSDRYYNFFKQNFFSANNLKVDLRRGCKGLLTAKEIDLNKFDIALGAQKIFEEIVLKLVQQQLKKFNYKQLIWSGGCALNCKLNTKLVDYFNDAWVFPNPGDSGAAVGAALSINKTPVQFNNAFLGYDAGNNDNITDIVNILKSKGVVGVVNGRAEFGPRALGNRSILADPRIPNIKDIVNGIKGRELFRPFAPAILKQHAASFFNIKNNIDYSYMQFLCECKTSNLPGIVHVDNTSRIQTVDSNNAFLHSILNAWYNQTGCPVLLNTSLNKKGLPLLNCKQDIKEFDTTDLQIVTPS
jgi:carbamoyltransferase